MNRQKDYEDFKTTFLSLSLSLVVLISQSTVNGQQELSERPNILFIIADDINWDGIGCYGNPSMKTPVIDQLAKRNKVR